MDHFRKPEQNRRVVTRPFTGRVEGRHPRRFPRSLAAATAFAFAVLAACGDPAPAPEGEPAAVPAGAPRLVLLIAVDQMRADYLERFAPLLTQGLARLLREGIVFTDTHQFHAATETAPGHATLATGVFPSRHGIIANSWFDKETGAEAYCCGDPDHDVSPRNMLVPTLGDLLKAAWPQSRVFSASGKDRAAILMGGHEADGAWWYSRATGSWVTSTYYGNRDSQPSWLDSFNAESRLDVLFGTAWEPLTPLEHTAVYGIEPLQRGLSIDTFPHAFGGYTVERSSFYASIYRSPFVDGYLEDFAETLIDAEGLGADEVPDLLALGFSALDTVGHGYGPDAPETLDTILRLDRTIGELLDFVDERIGMENVVVALSSDHGVGRVPELVARDGGEGGRFGAEQTLCLQQLQLRLEERFGDGEWLSDTFYLEEDALAAAGADRTAITDEIVAAMSDCPLFAGVLRPTDLDPSDPLHELYLNSSYPGRSPDLIAVPEPNVLPAAAAVVTASHGSPYRYDTHVPLIIRRQDGAGRVVAERANTIDLAPSLASILGLEVDDMDDFEGFDGVDRLAGL